VIQVSSYISLLCQSRPHGLRRGSAFARALGLLDRILLGTQVSVSCECCVLPGRGLHNGQIHRGGIPTESVSAIECDQIQQ
jgi:hypothetical protein